MCILCQPHVDVHNGGEGVWLMWTHVDREVKNPIFCGCHKWMAPNDIFTHIVVTIFVHKQLFVFLPIICYSLPFRLSYVIIIYLLAC